MNRFTYLAPYALSLLALACVTCGFTLFQGEDRVCDGRYAICTSAKCMPDPNDKSKTICFCEVAKGKNFGQDSCAARTPFTDKEGVEHLISTYSFAQYETLKTMTCPSGIAWSLCLDKPCTVDPVNPAKAICSCDLMTTGDYVTLGGNCNKGSCKENLWSGAAPSDTDGAINVLVKALQLPQKPSNYCPE